MCAGAAFRGCCVPAKAFDAKALWFGCGQIPVLPRKPANCVSSAGPTLCYQVCHDRLPLRAAASRQRGPFQESTKRAYVEAGRCSGAFRTQRPRQENAYTCFRSAGVQRYICKNRYILRSPRAWFATQRCASLVRAPSVEADGLSYPQQFCIVRI